MVRIYSWVSVIARGGISPRGQILGRLATAWLALH